MQAALMVATAEEGWRSTHQGQAHFANGGPPMRVGGGDADGGIGWERDRSGQLGSIHRCDDNLSPSPLFAVGGGGGPPISQK